MSILACFNQARISFVYSFVSYLAELTIQQCDRMKNSMQFHLLTLDRHNDQSYLGLHDVAYPEYLRATDFKASGFW
jgi:hypothetical protein